MVEPTESMSISNQSPATKVTADGGASLPESNAVAAMVGLLVAYTVVPEFDPTAPLFTSMTMPAPVGAVLTLARV
jgi:hypothetical protein